MARSIRWQVPFKSLKGTSYKVNIYEENWSGGVTTLVASADPFVINETSDDNYFTPVRSSTGYLRVIDNGNLSSAIFSTSGTQHYVELVDSSNNVHWMGFLQPSSFDMTWSPAPREISLPVSSLLETLKGFELDKTIGIITTHALFAQAFGKIGVMPRGIYEPVILESTNSIFKYSLSTARWLKENEYDKNDANWEQYTSTNYFTIFEDIFRYWGLTLREYRGELYLCASDVTQSYRHYSAQDVDDLFDSGSAQSTSSSAPYEDLSDYTINGSDHKVSILQGAKKVIIEGDFGATETILNVPNFESLKQGSKTRLGTQMQRLIYPYGIAVRQYAPQSSATDYALVYDNVASVNDSAKCEGGYPWGESIVKLASFSTGEVLGGCLLRLQDWSGDTKPDKVNLTDTICLKGLKDKKLISLFEYPVVITEGCLELNATVAHLGSSSSVSGHLVLYLRVGSKYYNGTTWQNSQCTFNVTYSNGKIVNTNTYDSDYDGADGYIIPLDTLSGSVELGIYGPYDQQYAGSYVLLIQGLKITHYHLSSSIHEGIDRDKNQYIKSLNNGFTEDVTISNNVVTFQENKMGSGFLLSPNGSQPAHRFTYADGSESIPERKLLARMQSWYNRTIRKIDVAIDYDNTFKPNCILTDERGNECLCLSVTTNFWDDKQTITLEENS